MRRVWQVDSSSVEYAQADLSSVDSVFCGDGTIVIDDEVEAAGFDSEGASLGWVLKGRNGRVL